MQNVLIIPNGTSGQFLTGPRVQERYGVSQMTIWRWERDQKLGFPQPTRIARHKYWKLTDLEAWERAQATNSATTIKTKPEAESDKLQPSVVPAGELRHA